MERLVLGREKKIEKKEEEMLLISHEEASGRKMYLTDCMGTYFWSPCKTSAKQFDESEVAKQVFELKKSLVAGKKITVEKAVMYIPYFSLEHPWGLIETLFVCEENSSVCFKSQMNDLIGRFDSTQIAKEFVDKLKLFPGGKYWILDFWEEAILQ